MYIKNYYKPTDTQRYMTMAHIIAEDEEKKKRFIYIYASSAYLSCLISRAAHARHMLRFVHFFQDNIHKSYSTCLFKLATIVCVRLRRRCRRTHFIFTCGDQERVMHVRQSHEMFIWVHY